MNNLIDFFEEENIVDVPHDWKNEWAGMPEFIQEAKPPYAMINIRFNNEEDLQEFANLINQKLNKKTKSIWHPKLDRHKNANLKWVDESNE